MWIDGRNPTYSDTAGTVLAAPFAGRVRRTNYGAPAVGNAQAPSDAARPYREADALGFQVGGGHYLNAPVASNCAQNAVTVALNFTARDKPEGGVMSLAQNGVLQILLFSANYVTINHGGGTWLAAPIGSPTSYVPTPLGVPCSLVVRLSPTSIKASVIVDGVRTECALTTSVAATNLPAANWVLGADLHGTITQALVVQHTLSDGDNDSLIAWLTANPAPRYCPSEVSFVGVSGNSIARAGAIFSVPIAQSWAMLTQQTLDATQPVNLVNTAISGDQIVHQRSVYTSILEPFVDVARVKNGIVLAAGTNDIATLGHSGPTTLADQYASADLAIADGSQPFVCTILPRNPGGVFDVATFNTAANYYNSHLRSEAIGRGYRLIDFAAISQAADPTNTTYYSDGIHPTIALHALMAAVAVAALQTWLSESTEEEEVDDAPHGLSSVLTYDQEAWHRPGVDELGGGSHENVTKSRDPRTVPDADLSNQLVRQIVSQASLTPSVRLQVTFAAGVPSVSGLVALNTTLVAADFTLTDNGAGDTSLTLTKYVGEQLRPLELTVAEDVEIDRDRVFAITNGWRVKTKLGATGTDAAFVLALHAPAQH